MHDKDYEIVIGLEVHSELKTKSKIFCGCTTEFGGEPNTHCCPICIGMPGTLPVLNEKVVEFAIRAGLATNSKMNTFSKQDRKNYFYPDLPKAYQVSQYDLPLCYDGKIEIEIEKGRKNIGITRIHIEEDAGKLIHDIGEGSLVDYNRCGVPLIEIVSEPDLRSAEEVRSYLEKLRRVLLYCDVSDCKMDEGSLRCDVNLSVRRFGESEFGTRTEMKNMNSFHFIVKAVEYEAKRQIKLLEEGEKIIQETRRWDESKGITISMRSKEEAHDYRYFPEPDLMPIVTDEEQIERIRKSLPEMPDEKKSRYLKDFSLTEYDADLIVASRNISEFYEEACKGSNNRKGVANWIITEVFSKLTEKEKEDGSIPFKAILLGELVELIDGGIISSSIAKTVFHEMWDSGKNPGDIVDAKGLRQINDDSALQSIAEEVIDNNPKPVEDYLNGKGAALNTLMGQVMKQTKGKANPQVVTTILKKLIETKR